MARFLYLFIVMAAMPVVYSDVNPAPPNIPSLNWQERSDWINVKTDVSPKAVGDGVADDAAALQAALNKVQNGTTLYFPAGTYRLTKTLALTGPFIGINVIGHGRDTTLVWDGEKGGKMFDEDGVAYSRYEGLQFDGRGKASIGFYHKSNHRFETEVRHRNLAFRNFTVAGILEEKKDKYALAETLFDNCLFDKCETGVSFTSFNDYNYTFNGCEFVDCGIGLLCIHGNFYVRDCHFEKSRKVDIASYPEHGCSVRRATSFGSAAFLHHSNGVSPITIQDCQVEAWTDGKGAISLNGASMIMFDNVFRNGPKEQPPVTLGRGLRLVASENKVEGAPAVFREHKAYVYDVPAGKRSRNLGSARQSFLKSEVPMPGKIFDAKVDFGAKGDGKTDDTEAVQKTIDAARKHGKNALAYFPTGRYRVKKTIMVTGSDYIIGGTGFRCIFSWGGEKDGTMMTVKDVGKLRIEYLALGNHDSGTMSNKIDILHLPSSQPSSEVTYDCVFVYGMYQKNSFRKGLHFRNLKKTDTVILDHVQGNLRFIDSAQATILGNCTYEGSIVVEGKDRKRDGFLGFMTRLSTLNTHGLYLQDNQNIVMSDFYVEQADNGFVFSGSNELPSGRATIQGAKVDFSTRNSKAAQVVMEIDNYKGQIFFGADQFYASLPRVPIIQKGRTPVELFLWANTFYNTYLDVTKEGGLQLRLIGNYGKNMTKKRKNLDADQTAQDNVKGDQLTPLSEAMDDLRHLREIDLKLNHGKGRL